jgi:hypothetical protein
MVFLGAAAVAARYPDNSANQEQKRASRLCSALVAPLLDGCLGCNDPCSAWEAAITFAHPRTSRLLSAIPLETKRSNVKKCSLLHINSSLISI